jgi:hypothetical protein
LNAAYTTTLSMDAHTEVNRYSRPVRKPTEPARSSLRMPCEEEGGVGDGGRWEGRARHE